MKKILLISDTHGYLDPRLFKYMKAADEVWHAGDIGGSELADEIAAIKPFRAVFGNIDGAALRSEYPENLIFECEKLKVLMTHIGGSPGKYPARVKSIINETKPGIFICGHSHILKVVYDKELSLLHMNPGAAGKQGFHQVRTALQFEIKDGAAQNLQVIELGKRSE